MIIKPLCIILTAAMLVFVAGCTRDDGPETRQSSKPAPSGPAQPEAPEPSAPPAPKPVKTTWPFLTDDQIADTVAENLTARNYFMVFDGSGSMMETKCAGARRKIEVAREAVTAWSKSVPADANLGLFAFHGHGIATLPLTAGNRDAFNQTIERLDAGGNTPLTKALEFAYQAFTEQGRRQLGYGEYTIVVVTDGLANHPKELQYVVDRILTDTPINIYSIGFCIESKHSLNQPGRTLYKSANNPAQLQEGLQEALAEAEFFDESEFAQ